MQKEKRLAVKKKKKDAKEKNNCLDEQTRNEEIAKGGEDGSRLGAERQKERADGDQGYDSQNVDNKHDTLCPTCVSSKLCKFIQMQLLMLL